MAHVLRSILIILALLAVLLLVVSSAAWAWRNPKGNAATYWIYFPAPLTFARIPELQLP